MLPGQGGKANNGVHRGADVVGHVGEECVFGLYRRLRLAQGIGHGRALLLLAPERLVHAPGSQHHLGDPRASAHVHHLHLQILRLVLPQNPVVDQERPPVRQPAPDPVRVQRRRQLPTVLGAHPSADILPGEGGEGPYRLLPLAELPPETRADPVGPDGVRVQVHVEDGFVVNTQSLDDLQPPQMLLVDDLQLGVVGLQLLCPPAVLLQQGVPLRRQPQPFLGGVPHKDVEHIPHRLAADKVPVVLQPADLSVPADYPVLHIVQIVLTVGNLLPDAPLHLLQVLRVDHPPEGIAGQSAELLPAGAAEYPQQRGVGVEDLLLPAGPVDEEAAGHFVDDLHDVRKRVGIRPGAAHSGYNIFNQALSPLQRNPSSRGPPPGPLSLIEVSYQKIPKNGREKLKNAKK